MHCERLKGIWCKVQPILSDLSLLSLRLILAYGFYGTAKMKLGNLESVAEWFGTLGIPMPLLNAYLAAGTEAIGVLLLTLGLATRLISVPLMFVMIVAVATVHWKNGFSAGDNGYEIPLYFFLMLFALVAHGAGRISLDAIIARKCCGGGACSVKDVEHAPAI